MTSLSIQRESGITRLVLQPPPGKPPTLNEHVLGQLEAALEELHAQPPRLVLVASETPKYFCVGADINALRQLDSRSIQGWVERGHRVFNRLEDLPCPTVARVSGYALGGGLELALACDLIYATGESVLGLPEATLGFIPGWGGTLRLAERVGLPAAKRMFYAAKRIKADEALRLGLVDEVCAEGEIDRCLDELVAEVTANGAFALGAFKCITHLDRQTARQRSLDAEREFSEGCLEQSDTLERLADFFSRKSKD